MAEDRPEKMDLRSMDIVEKKLGHLKDIFPEVFSDNRVNFDQLKHVLGEWVEPEQERFGLIWAGRAECMRVIQEPTDATLKPDRDESVNFDDTGNLFIEGDNLQVLKLLQKSYFGKVKMIYIDPPYNTGNEFIYSDKYGESLDTYLAYTGQIDKDGNKLSTNTDSQGRFHSNWLNMMYPRLYLARNLLRRNGAIFISIDDNEQANLKKLCDEVFGEENFVAQLVWAAGRKNDSKLISVSHEYILCYVRDRGFLKENKIIWRNKKKGLDDIYRKYDSLRKKYESDNEVIQKELKQWYESLSKKEPAKAHEHYSHVDNRGIYFPADISWPRGEGPKYEVLHPVTEKPCKIPSRGWRFSKVERMNKEISENWVHFGKDETTVPCMKSYLKEGETEVPYSVYDKDGRGATKRLRKLLGGDYFGYPKDEFLLGEIIEFVTGDDRDAIVLDFFAGSGTIAQSVMTLNSEDNRNRKFICVQLPEPIGEKEKAFSAGYSNISDLSKERIRRAAKSIEEERDPTLDFDDRSNIDLGFKVFRLEPSNFKAWSPDTTDMEGFQRKLEMHVSNVVDGSTAEAILYELLLTSGFPLTVPIKEIELAGKKVFLIENGAMIVCLEEHMTTELIDALADQNPLQVVCLDRAFHGDDQLKVNAVQTFRSRADSGRTEIIFRTV